MFLCTYTNFIVPQRMFFLFMGLGTMLSIVCSCKRQLITRKNFRYSQSFLTKVTNTIFVDKSNAYLSSWKTLIFWWFLYWTLWSLAFYNKLSQLLTKIYYPIYFGDSVQHMSVSVTLKALPLCSFWTL